ncbi:MAG: 3-oxoadipate enol-lactonase [Pseudomonadota bacterium]|nr:MAG: 3-oxoadipate enol-lactonase [Pseudomonadota bacterium]
MRIRANGIELNYTVEGEGPWLVMSHALACDLHMWDDLAAWLAQRFTVLRYDIRGHGRSDAPSGPYSLEMLADDAAALLDALGVEHVHWVGLSMGGMIGQVFALAHPERVRSLVLADTSSRYGPEVEAIWAERIRIAREQGMDALVQPTLERWFTPPFRAAHPELMRRIGDMIRTTPVEGYAGCGLAIAKLDFTDRLRGLRCPALVLVGEQDSGTPVGMAREIQAAIPGAQLVVIPSASHLSHLEQPEAFRTALERFYGSLAA